MAHVKSPDERGVIGAWAYEARIAHDWSVERVIEELPTRYHPATLRKVESGASQPGRRMLRELADLYGSEPPGQKESGGSPEGTAAIIAAIDRAIDRQTEAIVNAIRSRDSEMEALIRSNTALLDELGRYRKDQLGVLRTLTAPRAVPMPQAEPEPGPPAPAPTRSGRA